MIKPEQVPKEVADALWQAICDKPGIEPKKAIAAALNAWEGASHEQDQLGGNWHRLILPLPTEASDE